MLLVSRSMISLSSYMSVFLSRLFDLAGSVCSIKITHSVIESKRLIVSKRSVNASNLVKEGETYK